MHILFIPSWYSSDHGPLRGIFFREQAIGIRDSGADVGVLYPDFRSLREFSFGNLVSNHFQRSFRIDHGINTFSVSGWNVPFNFMRPQLYTWFVKKLSEEYIRSYGKPDVLHAQSALYGGLAARKLSQDLSIPYVVTEHSSAVLSGQLSSQQKKMLELIYQDAAMVMSVSSALSTEMGKFIKLRNIVIVPNFIDTTFFSRPPGHCSQIPYRFLSIGWLNGKKGMKTLIQAFYKAFRSTDNVVLEIGGDGPERAELSELVSTLNMQERIHFLGTLTREGVRDALWRANAYVSASDAETFGVTLIEAMSTGLPVVATRCGGPEDIVNKDVGVLVPKKCINALAKGLKEVFNKKVEFLEKREGIREYLIKNYGKESVSEKLLKIYKEII